MSARKTFFSTLFLILILIAFSNAEGEFARKNPTLSFQIGIFEPYPSAIGVGINLYPNAFMGFSGAVGTKSFSDSRMATYSFGVKLLATREYVTPEVGFNYSSYESKSNERNQLWYLSTGLKYRFNRSIFLGTGAQWGLSPREGRTEVSPYVHFGAIY